MMRSSDLDLTLYVRTKLSGRRKGKSGASLPDRVKAALAVILRMAIPARDEHTTIRREW